MAYGPNETHRILKKLGTAVASGEQRGHGSSEPVFTEEDAKQIVKYLVAPFEKSRPGGPHLIVILQHPGPAIIAVIREVRRVTGLELAPAKALVDSAPKPLKAGLTWEEAMGIKQSFEAVGATVSIVDESRP